MERELRSVVCPDHNLRYDPTQSGGCVRCMRLLGTHAGRTAVPPVAKPAASGSSTGAKVVATLVVVVTIFLGWAFTRTKTEKAPEGAVVNDGKLFALIVPPRWKTVDPSTVTYLRDFLGPEDGELTLISDKGRLAPTVLVEVLDVEAFRPTRGDFAEIEAGFREEWGEDENLKIAMDLTTVDRLPAVRITASTLTDGEKVWLEQYLVPGKSQMFAVSAVHFRDRQEENAQAARAMVDGLRILERPPMLQGMAQKLVLGVLLLVLIAAIRVLTKG